MRVLLRGARVNAGSLVGARTWAEPVEFGTRVRDQSSCGGTGEGPGPGPGPRITRIREGALRSAARAQPLYGQRISSRALRTPLADAKPHFSAHLSHFIVRLASPARLAGVR